MIDKNDNSKLVCKNVCVCVNGVYKTDVMKYLHI